MRISDWSSDVCSSDLCRIDYSITSGNLEVKTRKARVNESPPQSDPVKFATRGDMEMPTRHYAARFSLSDLRSIPPVLCRLESRVHSWSDGTHQPRTYSPKRPSTHEKHQRPSNQ